MHTLKSRSHQRSWRYRRLPARRCYGTPPSLVGTATTATNTAGTVFSLTWTPTQAGTYIISVKATDNLNASTTTSTNQNRTVTVNALPNQAPVITLNAPTGGTGPGGNPNGSFTAPATISLNASASDANGSIAVVNFYQGATLIGAGTLTTGTSQNGTWTTSWSNVGQGSYTVTAIATDNAGASVTSTAIQITVNPGATGAAPGLYFIEVDHLNTPRRIANLSQQTVWKMDNTEAFGDSVPNENPSNLGTFEFNQRFPGQYADKETGLSYNYFRDYNAALGRYTQSDPIGLQGGINTYAYVNGNPLKYVDPTGEFAGIVSRGIVYAAGAIAAAVGIQGTQNAINTSSSSQNESASTKTFPRDFTHNPGRDECKNCNKCSPKEGTICAIGPHQESHGGLRGHYHLFQMIQGPDCTCRWNKVSNQVGIGVVSPSPFWAIPCPFTNF